MKNKTYLKIKRDRDGRWIAYSVPKTRPQVVIVGLIFIAYLICYMIYGYPAIAGTSIAYAGGFSIPTGRADSLSIKAFDAGALVAGRFQGDRESGQDYGASDPASDFCGLSYIECEEEKTLPPARSGVSDSTLLVSTGIIAGYRIGSYATNKAHEKNVARIYASIHVTNANEADAYIKARFPKSPVTGGMVYRASEKYGVDPKLVIAIIAEDSGCGTTGLGARTMNPGNVATYGKQVNSYASWELGVEAVARWMDTHRVK